MIASFKNEIAYFMRRLYEQRLTTTSGGNISIKHDGRILITPSSLDKGRITPEQISEMDMNGNPVGSSSLKLSIESRMHLEIYRARPDVCAIVHAHPPTATTFSALDLDINSRLASESYAILGNIARAEYALMGSPELAANVAAAVANSNCIIMNNHGALTVGSTILEAFDRLEVLENAAIITLNTLRMADAVRGLTPDQLSAIDRMMGRDGKNK